MIDLHTHSSRSDGTDTPAELVATAAAAGITTLGLTDHDTASGWAEAAEAARAHSIRLVRGVEMSATYLSHSVHILAYLLDADHEAFARHTASLRQARTDRLAAMIEAMAAENIITADEVAAHTPEGATPGRPHIADALVARGTYAHRDEAFAGVLSSSSPYYRPYVAPELEQVISTIHDCGGVAIWAHPMARSRWVPTEAEIRDGIALGLDGLEVDHRDNADRDLLGTLVRDSDLIRTGSSDYHGTGKVNRLGEFTTEPDQLEEICQRGVLEVIGG